MDEPFLFSAEVIYWRGPAPFLFALLPGEISAQIQAVSHAVSYGWGCIPVAAEIDGHAFTTSLFPRQGSYLLPLKVALQKKLPPIEIGDRLEVTMRIEARMPRL